MFSRIFAASALLALVAACQPSDPPAASAPAAAEPEMPAPVVAGEIGYPELNGRTVPPPAGFDPEAFEAFVATGPTPEAFEATYPDILLVLPDTMATREYRMDYSRFFADLDAAGRIVGGHFS